MLLLIVFDGLEPVQAVELVIFANLGNVACSGNVGIGGVDGRTLDIFGQMFLDVGFRRGGARFGRMSDLDDKKVFCRR